MLSRVALASILAIGAFAPAAAQDRMAPNALFFSGPNFTGRSLSVTRDMPIFQATWQPRSVRIGGGSSWEVCDQRHFRGRCRVISGSSANLMSQMGLGGVASVRRAAIGTQPPGPGGGSGQSLKGMAAEFFPAPQAHGRRIEACNNEGGSAACITRESDNFCRSMGYVRSRNGAAETVGGRIFLADVLCSRWN